MKKLLFLISLFCLLSFIDTSAQRGTQMSNTASSDTLITSASKDTVTKIITATAGYSSLGIQVNATKISGTVDAKAYLSGSIDGVNYTTTDSSSAFSDGNNYVWFTKSTTPYVFYKVDVRNSIGANTTQTVAVTVWYVARRHN